MTPLLGCAIDSDDSTTGSTSSFTAASSAGGVAIKPRAMAKKPVAAVPSPGLLPDEVIVKFKEGTHVRFRSGALRFDASALVGREPALLARSGLASARVATDVSAANALLAATSLGQLFDRPEADLEREKAVGEANLAEELADLNLYFHARVDPKAQAALIDQLNALDSVEIAYAPPRPEDAAADVPPATGSFTAHQDYVEAAPIGIDARYARTVQGGAGRGVKVIDIEFSWNFAHEDAPDIFTASGTQTGSDDHGTQVMGVIAAVENAYGMTGAASDVSFGVASAINTPPAGGPDTYSVARAVNTASASLSRGDIILIEQHAKGPMSNTPCVCNCAQFEYIAMEYWQAEFDAMQAATALGINVVEAAGNGSMDLDAARYGGNFDRAVRDSGAIVVGAGTSNGGLAPQCWTNHGTRVDVQGWGDSVATLGRGSLAMVNGPGDKHQFYSNSFSGTSSASPIVVSAVADVQGARIAHGLGVATTAAMRSLLVSTGTAQTGINHIGPLPNLRAALDDLAIRPKVAFVWTAVPSSVFANFTVIDNPATNNNPNAVVQVTHNWGNVAGVNDNHALGVWYTGSRWSIFHQDLSAIPANAKYNVVVNDGFVHRVTAANTTGHVTRIDNPYANNNPDAILIVTANWNPGGAVEGVYNNHPIGVWYNGSRWTIYNEDIAAMPASAAFNVAVSPHGTFIHTASSSSTFSNRIAEPLTANVLITHNFGPFATYNTKHNGVHYAQVPLRIGSWAVFNEDNTPVIANATFNVFVANAPRPGW